MAGMKQIELTGMKKAGWIKSAHGKSNYVQNWIKSNLSV